MKICIDAGHYAGYNAYPPFPQYNEGSQMWKLANYLKTRLEACGITVIMTKDTAESNPGLTTRGKKAKGCDMFISLHSNASGRTVSDVTGVEAYRSIFNDKDTFAAGVCEVIAKVMNTKNRGVKTRQGSGNWDYYSVMKGAVDVGVKKAYLIEHGFHTSVKDASFLIDDKNLEKLADAECEYICSFLGVKKPEAKPVEKPASPAKKENKYKIGDNVTFSTCYISSTATSAVKPKINHGKITKIVNARNPYLINNGQCWVNDGDIRGFYTEPKYEEYVITCKTLNIRALPKIASARIGVLHKGDIIQVINKSGDWYELLNGGWAGARKHSVKK